MPTPEKISKIIIKKDNLSELPVLSSGEFMLAEDEQRLFLGQKPLVVYGDAAGTDNTNATVKFEIKKSSSVVPLDLDGISEFSISVYDTDNPTSDPHVIPGIDVKINDDELEFAHGLGRPPKPLDSFTIYYNKEVTSFTAETGTKLHSTAFTNSGNAVEEIPGIEFNSSFKNTIVMNYTLFNVAGKMRKGTLNILVDGTTKSNIEDKYFGDSELSDVEFSLTNSGTIFKLNFKTSITTELNFDYTQTSTQNS